jgi:hypothetical protein
MKITINIDKTFIIETLEKLTRTSITFFYKWLTTEGEALGYILGSIHFMTGIFIFLLIVISHTLYPNFYFQLFAFMLLLAVWIQHIFLKVCVIIVAEKRLTNNISPFHALLKDIFGIESDVFGNYLMVVETTALCFFALELISRCSAYFQKYGGNYIYNFLNF